MGESKRRRDARAARSAYESLAPHERLGDAPIEDQYYQMMSALMRTIDEFINGPKGPDYIKRNGIVIMMFPFEGFDGRCNYMSNGASRQDIVILMREMIARFEGQPEIRGNA
jgi:hypothetical protein